MQTIAGFPFFEVQFNKLGGVHNDNELSELAALIGAGTITDLLVISHGWNNNIAEARSLYKTFFTQTRAEINNNRLPQIKQRSFAVLGLLWPSIKFEDAAL